MVIVSLGEIGSVQAAVPMCIRFCLWEALCRQWERGAYNKMVRRKSVLSGYAIIPQKSVQPLVGYVTAVSLSECAPLIWKSFKKIISNAIKSFFPTNFFKNDAAL